MTPPASAHRIGRLHVEIGVANFADALQLRARAEEIAWRQIPDVIEKVFDALAPSDLHVRIDRLALDLGEIGADTLALELPAAFERALRSALADAIATAVHAPHSQARACTPAAARLDEFEAYLVDGTLPMRRQAAPFAPAAVLAWLLAQQPAALAALLRRHAHDRYAIERLVLQAETAQLHALAILLAPAHASFILACLADLRRLYGSLPGMRLAEAALRRVLWISAFGYLLDAAASQFERRAFLAALIDGVAAGQGGADAALPALLHGAARMDRTRRPPAAALLGLLDALSGASDGAVRPAAGAAFASAEAGDVEPLLALLRGAAFQPLALETLLRPMSAALFASVIGRLQPVHAALILAYMAGLSSVHRVQPQLALSAPRFERQLRMLALRYLLLDAGSQFNRISWLRRLLSELAAGAGLGYPMLLAALTEALDVLRERMPLSGSLLDALQLLGAELAPRQTGAAAPRQDDSAELLARLERHGADPAAVTALVRACTKAQLAGLVERIAPLHATTILADIALLTTAHRLWALLADATLGQRVAPAALRLLMAGRGLAFDRGNWLRQLFQALAAAVPISYDALLLALADWRRHGAPEAGVHQALAQLARSAPLSGAAAQAALAERHPEAAIALAERFLRTGQPQGQGRRLSALAAIHPQGFAALLRRLLVANSGNADALIQRCLVWMLPEEIAATLLPGQVEAAARWADLLADQPGATMAVAWGRVLDTALRGARLDGPGAMAWPGGRLDRMAVLRHYLDTAALPWWAGPEARLDDLLAGLPGLSLVALHSLFADERQQQIVLRLQRMFERSGADLGAMVLARLAPWAHAGLGADLAGPALDGARIRAAAAAIAGLPLDVTRLALPLAPPPAAAPVAPAPESDDKQGTSRWLAWLAGAPHAAPPSSDVALRGLAELFADADPAVDAALRAGLARLESRQRWAAVMPEEILARLAHRRAPAQARFMLDARALVLAAWRHSSCAPAGRRPDAGQLLWCAVLALLAETVLPAPRLIAARLLACLAAERSAAAAVLRAHALGMAQQGGYAHVGAALQAPPAAPAPPVPPPAPARRPAAEGSTLYIANAGLVLLHPFLPRFFKQLGLTSLASADHAGGAGVSGVACISGTEAATRAVHLLQYMVDGRADAPEPELALNKLLCGLALDTPVAGAITPDAAEVEACGAVLDAVIAHWPPLVNTSRAGLRETFLQRDGRLVLRDGKWTLTVSRKTLDVLLDQLPWGFAVVLHPWMPQALSVEW